MDTPTSRQSWSTRGFTTCDPERQGVIAGLAMRAAPRAEAPAPARAMALRMQDAQMRKAAQPRALAAR